MSDQVEDVEVLIDDYLDGRMEPSRRKAFEERMSKDPVLRGKVMSATQSVEMVQQALGWVTPGEEFDDKVNSKIINLTQSGNLVPAVAANARSLTSNDPDAKLLGDPDASRESRRLAVLGVIAAIIFALAAGVILYVASHSQPSNIAPFEKK